MNIASKRISSTLYLIATQSHGNGSCCGEVSIPWVCVEKDEWTSGPRCHAHIHAVRSEVKSTVRTSRKVHDGLVSELPEPSSVYNVAQEKIRGAWSIQCHVHVHVPSAAVGTSM